MALDAHVSTFVRQAGTGNQSVTGVGFTPKVVLFWGSNKTAEGFGSHNETFWGAMTATEEMSWSSISRDNTSFPGGNQVRGDRKAIVISKQAGMTVSASALFVSMDADGFTINWDVNDGTANIIHYTALGGSDLTNVKVHEWVAATATGNQAVTGVGFPPDFILFAGNNILTALPANDTNAYFSCGAAVSSTERNAIGYKASPQAGMNDKAATSQRTTKILVFPKKSGQMEDEADFVSMDADGFTVNWINAPMNAAILAAVCLKGTFQKSVHAFDTPAATGNDTITLPGFQPKVGYWAGWNRNASTDAPSDNKKKAEAGYGAAISSTQRGSWGLAVNDGTSPTQADDWTVTTKCIRQAAAGATPTVTAEADFVQWETNGYTLNWTTVPGTAVQILSWVLGDAAAPPAGGPPVGSLALMGAGR